MNPEARRVEPKSEEELAKEWDVMAAIRDDQVGSGRDLSFTKVITPTLLALLPSSTDRLVDVGCGTGLLTIALLNVAREVVGVDPSEVSIARAISRAKDPRVTFVRSTIESYAHETSDSFDAAVANMSLMTFASLETTFKSVFGLLRRQGCFAFSITHPWFWPAYWGYSDAPWFDYNSEVFIEAPFRISNQGSGPITTHIHRPLHMYFAKLTNAGFEVDVINEPMPSQADEALYPARWKYPRFLLARATKK